MATTKKQTQRRKSPAVQDGLHVKGDGTATVAVTVGGAQRVYELRRPTLGEYADFTDWVEVADDAYAAEVQPPGVLDRIRELQQEGAKADAVVREAQEAREKGEQFAGDMGAAMLAQAEIIAELGEINKGVERRANRTFRPDAPHIQVLVRIIGVLNTVADVPDPEPDQWPPSFTQPTVIRSLYEGLRLPLVPGTNGNRSQRRAANRDLATR